MLPHEVARGRLERERVHEGDEQVDRGGGLEACLADGERQRREERRSGREPEHEPDVVEKKEERGAADAERDRPEQGGEIAEQRNAEDGGRERSVGEGEQHERSSGHVDPVPRAVGELDDGCGAQSER